MAEQNNRLGAWLMISATLIFAFQDGISRHLGATYHVFSIVMVRYWVFALFGIWLAARSDGGLSRAMRSKAPVAQVIRSLLLVAEIAVMFIAYVRLGLIESHAVFTSAPLMVAALSAPILGEKVGWRRWAAIGVGCFGVLIILEPGVAVFSIWALVPLFGAFLFALYSLMTRYVGRVDSSAVSLFWSGLIGALVLTVPGIWMWEPMTLADSLWLATLCCSGVMAHYLLIRCYEVAEASSVQPFAYLQLVFIATIGISVFGEALHLNQVIGAAIVVAAGLFTLWRQHVRARAAIARSVQP